MFKSEISDKILRLFNQLVLNRSDTETPLENEIETYMLDWFKALEYFRNNPDFLGIHQLESDPLNRSVIWALVRGSGAKTAVLVNHHDTVDATDYGRLSKYAFNPEKLVKELSEFDLPEEARRDLESGGWIFGRGAADMKAGAAIQMTLIEEFSKRSEFEGNLLYISVPGEEFMSWGMINGVNLLEHLKEQFKLDFRVLIDSEPHERGKDGAGIIYEGTAGKMLAVIYVSGKKVHVGNVLSGLNPLFVLSEIVLQTELNVDFVDSVSDEFAPPPTWMFLRDRQAVYDGSVPISAAGFLSIISLCSKPGEILSRLIQHIEVACSKVAKDVRDRHEKYISGRKAGQTQTRWAIRVNTFSEMYEMALESSGEHFVEEYEEKLEALHYEIKQNRLSLHEGTLLLIEKVLDSIPDKAPSVVVAFAPPYYPHLSNKDYPLLPESIPSLTAEIITYPFREWNERYRKLAYFMQISDLSFGSFHDIDDTLVSIGRNMPFWEKYYGKIFNKNTSLSLPVLNIGPWGKDLHKFTERVYKRDVEERTYRILSHAIEYVLK